MLKFLVTDSNNFMLDFFCVFLDCIADDGCKLENISLTLFFKYPKSFAEIEKKLKPH